MRILFYRSIASYECKNKATTTKYLQRETEAGKCQKIRENIKRAACMRKTFKIKMHVRTKDKN